MFNNFAQQINSPNVSGNGHSVILACKKSINCVMVLILNSQRPFSLPGTLLARAVHFSQPNCTGWYNFGCENCTWWYLLFQLEKRGGDQIFQRGTDFFRKYWSPRTIFWSGGTVFGGTNCYVTVQFIIFA